MHHDHSSFDRTRPDVEQAVTAALPLVIQLRAERAKSQPKDADQLCAWRSYIGDLEGEIAQIAARIDWTGNKLERVVGAEIGRRRVVSPPTARPVAPAPAKKPDYAALALEEVNLLREVQQLEEEEGRTQARLTLARKQLAAIRAKLQRYGSRRSRG